MEAQWGRREAPHISRKNKEGRRSERKLQRSTMGGYAEEEGEITTAHNGEYREEKELSKRLAVRM